MNRLWSAAVVATVVAALRGDARACDLVGNFKHTVDTTMHATDHTPPTLPAIPPPEVHFGDEESQGCLTRSDCAGTLQVVAVDLAGNESAPQTVHVSGSSGQGCAIARGRRPGHAFVWLALGALALAARRRRRNRSKASLF